MGDAADVANDYVTAFYAGDHKRARTLVADDFSFKGPFVEASSADAFFASAAPLAQILRGHRMLRQWADGDDVCSLFEMKLETPAGGGTVVLAEWHAVKNARLVSGRVVFDTAAFRAVVPSR